jgi:endo-1,4-beta-mannosidase
VALDHWLRWFLPLCLIIRMHNAFICSFFEMLITSFSDCQGLDFVISEARKYGVRLILALTNNYQDYGGRPQYVKWARSAGVAVNGDDDFYTNAVVKGYYKNHVKVIL